MKLIYDREKGIVFCERLDKGYLVTIPFIKGCWAGNGEGKNNPEMEKVKEIGPLPKGSYLIMPPVDHPRLGPFALRLIPDETNHMYGRSDFWVHGPSKNPSRYGNESKGCIIMDRVKRIKLWESGILKLEVI